MTEIFSTVRFGVFIFGLVTVFVPFRLFNCNSKKNAHLILSFEYKPVAFGFAFGQRVEM
jgi:hypothetical protein